VHVRADNPLEVMHDDASRFPLLQRRGDELVGAGDHEGALEYYDRAARCAPDQPAPYVGLGHVYIHTGRLDRAQRAFRIAIGLDADCAAAYDGLAMIHQHRREYPAAFETYLKCLSLNPDNLVALLGLFQASCQMGTFGRIIGYLERYLAGHPGDASVLLCLGSLYAREGRLPEASRALRKVLRAEPHKPEAAMLLAEVNAAILASTAGTAG